jgi:poly(3-hydroxybutyrate) depolymerase
MAGHPIATRLLRTSLVAAIAAVLLATVAPAETISGMAQLSAGSTVRVASRDGVRELKLHYRASGGQRRIAFLILPSRYGPHNHPALPLIISPHGRGAGPFLELARAWGPLATRRRFAIVVPEGQGRRLAHHSWGYPGQIDDLARMPEILREAVPWLRIDSRRIYAVGGSMGGQETLLLVARYPHLLAGAVSFDAPTDLARRYAQFAVLSNCDFLRGLMRIEIGGPPDELADSYEERSPLHFAEEIASSGVPLQIWWSTRDELVVDQRSQSGLLYARIKQLDPAAPVTKVVGTWPHTAELRWDKGLPEALRFLGLLPRR